MFFSFEINDLKFFMLMLTVFILGFGISSHSLVHGTQQFSWHLPREIINRAYWEIFGDLNSLDTFEGKNEESRIGFHSSLLFTQTITNPMDMPYSL